MQPAIEQSLREVDTEQNRLILWAVLAVFFIALLWFGARVLRRRGAVRKLHLGIVSASIEYLQNVLVPDGMGAGMHVDYLLLTSRGVVVIDLRDVRRQHLRAATR